jgi:thiol:disulfide interchange protein
MFNSVFRRISLGVLLLMVGTIPALIASEEVKWEKTLEDSMTQAAKTGKPMMMDFYTDW